MELDNINNILEKYFDAETTIAEEKALKEYFVNGAVKPEHEKYVPIFAHLTKAKEEKFTKQIPLKKKKTNTKWFSAAAVAMLLFGLYLGNNYLQQKRIEKEQAAYAYQETKKALNLLAQNFNKGKEKIAYLEEFEQTKQKIYNDN
ncbi:hypothetical protein I2486_00175 [Cellulophaga sp. E16_2]|uniref:hypothetical protein n=1 Tax=Cellulophaga sp. E16_2 TaxID=2789297 RepID=UPI001A917BC5|nr:hypothetical protein [Cellulophaga sp. E16_2]MBO0589812.1 hypothetical protein [Cellulophaga sp. E16_2]